MVVLAGREGSFTEQLAVTLEPIGRQFTGGNGGLAGGGQAGSNAGVTFAGGLPSGDFGLSFGVGSGGLGGGGGGSA